MVGRRVLAAAVGAWLSVFVAAPALAAGPRAGGASAAAVQAKVSPLAVVPSSVFAQLSSLTNSLNLGSVDSSLGDASLALDQTTVNGSLGSLNVYGKSDANSEPVVVNVAAVAKLLSVLQTELQSLGLSSTVSGLQAQLQALEGQLAPSGSALAQYLNVVNNLTQNGSLELQAAHAVYPGTPSSMSLNVIDPSSITAIKELKALAPYTAAASDGDATANHTVEATSSVDALDLLDLGAIPIGINSDALATLNGLITTIEAALAPAAAAAGVTLPPADSITGTITGTLGNTINQLTGTVTTVSSAVNTVIPAGTPVSDLTGLLTQLLNLKAALTALPTSIDLSSIVSTSDVASDVKTTVTNGVVDSLATTKAADIKLLTVNSPQLVQALGVSQGNALAEIIGATATAEAKADGKTSTATGSGAVTEIKLLPGSSIWSSIPNSNGGDITAASLTGLGNTFVKDVGPLRVTILTGACNCIDQAHGGTADAASAAVSALEIKLSYIGDPNLLIGTTAPAALTSPQGTDIPLLDVQLATVNANAGNNVTLAIAKTGSVYGVGFLVGFLMLVGALGIGVTYRRFAAVKVRG